MDKRETKFTPGPWVVTPDGCYIYAPAFGTKIADCRYAINRKYPGNVALLGAAPELLEALESIVRFMRPLRQTHISQACLDQCTAAIRKAKGEL